jgi:tryptophan synthase alpha chain
VDRLKESFQEIRKRGTPGVIPYLTAGFPSIEETVPLLTALVDGGADVIELGVPFSDPLADGPTIQRSSFHALSQGVNLGTCLNISRQLRDREKSVPLVFMGYYNPILSYGLERFAQDASDAGLDGVIVPDLPYEEAETLQTICGRRGIHLIPLLAPTSTDERIAKTCEKADAFVYCVSVTGVTGARQELPSGIPALTQRVRKHTDLPIAIGFGISQSRHVQALAPWADAAVVGSALIDLVENTPSGQREKAVREFVAGLKAAPSEKEES